MRREEKKPGQIGDYWLSQNRHGVWCRTWYDPTTRHVRVASLGTRDFESAILRLAEWIVLHDRITRADPTDLPVAVVLDRYYEHHGSKIASADATKRAVAQLKAFYGDASVAGLTLDRQGQFERELLEAGKAPAYIGRIQTVLKAALRRAYKNQEITHVPYIRVLGSNAQRERVLTLEECAALFNAAPPEHLFRFLLLAFNTLSRPGALLDLQPFQADLGRRRLNLNPPGRAQTKKFRPVVPITDTLLPWLREWRDLPYYVHTAKAPRAPLSSIKTAWRKLRRRAGLGPDVDPYTIRHTMASEMRRRSVPKWEVEGWLGHDGGTTDIYAKFDPDYLAQGARAIDAFFAELAPLVDRRLVLHTRPNVVSLRGHGEIR